ncbi:MAG: 1-deoxy-D-xylulose-5-phosphate reductoisomerase [Phycisphaerales bacterium]|jgi:1-deoxy-D-xylulose-5-phosphate reductoisomerase|nr:1-deoxy-D-xylulose-5-phosphate reductoisomerase [Phycisphaerales bacterium]MBT7171538.1 1-deoxy-D-xylulose-5-phosphate reductoisomerase [Phycisphaerales bacterium]
MTQRALCILGSTGSIGTQTLEVVDELGSWSVSGLAAGRNGQMLVNQAAKYRPAFAAIGDESQAPRLRTELPAETELLSGPDGLCEMVRRSDGEMVLSAVVGSAGLKPMLTAIDAGKTVALANKETLVCAGELVMGEVAKAGTTLLPVDSEHSGLLQCLLAGRRDEVRRVMITSSGGALRDWSDAKAADAKAADALNHPTWEMGAKITIDSATLMNKVLEVIEAHWLFDLPAEQIDVVIHPQSMIHAMVEFCDGSIIAQMAAPDMTLPIAYALDYPNRPARNITPVNFAELGRLDFRETEGRNLDTMQLAWDVIRLGGCSGAVLNGANEQAVEAFLAGKIRFGQIVATVRTVLDEWTCGDCGHTTFAPGEAMTLDAIVAADAWSRTRTRALLGVETE